MSHAALGSQSPSPRPRLSSAERFGCALRQGDAFAQAFGLFDDLADSPHVRLFAHRLNLGGLRCIVFGRQWPHVAGVARVEADPAVFADVGDAAADDVLDPVFRDEAEEQRILGGGARGRCRLCRLWVRCGRSGCSVPVVFVPDAGQFPWFQQACMRAVPRPVAHAYAPVGDALA